jgi:phosphoglycolate phosphatase-like HAD superfamily hydrolase
VLAAFGVEARDALVVGDMDVDVAAARAVGARAVGIQEEAGAAEALRTAGAAAVLADLGELRRWLSENGTGWGYHWPGSGEGR